MPAPYLARKGASWVFQIRFPKKLDPDLRLAPLRVAMGAMPARQARKRALLFAAAAQIAFARVGVMKEDKAVPGEKVPRMTKEEFELTLRLLAALDDIPT